MSNQESVKDKININSKRENKDEINVDNQENQIKLIKRTLENNTHVVIEDTKLKNITSWRKSQTKFLQNLIFNILSFGILHIISLHYPKLYLKLYCNPWPPKECDFFLVENIYGQFTLCEKIHKKSKNTHMSFISDATKDNMTSPSLINFNNKIEHYLTKNLTYSFKYKSMTYEYNEETSEVIPVYMNLSKMTHKGIFNFFNDGLSTDILVKKIRDRYGKNEYYINLGLSFFYFKRIEAMYLILILIIELINLFFKDFVSFSIFFGIITVLFLLEYIVTKQIIYDQYEKEYTLDGEKNKLRVKRKNKYMNSSDLFFEIKNCDLLPGDIIYLKSKDLVPCDCLILEGDCIVNESHLTGSLDVIKKTSLENNNELFNYKLSKINILYHGMKIVKTISKLNEGYITVLCINTGPNTYKANQYSNILYLLERKLDYRKTYEILGEGRVKIVYMIIGIVIFSTLLGVIFIFSLGVNLDFKNPELVKLFYLILIRIIFKSFMPVYFITNSIIYFMGIFHLKNENIFCFEKSKLISPSRIDTIFFSKTGILCENNFEINGYHPIYINPHRANSISYRTYKENQYKEMNSQLLKYYKGYLDKRRNEPSNQDFNLRHALRVERNQLIMDKMSKESCECTTIFLECLLSCNNIEKYNTEIFGNSIEIDIFKNMNWDIKSYRFNNNNISDKSDDSSYSNSFSYLSQSMGESKKYYYDDKFNLIDKNINDIYPNNYYKITESIKNESELQIKPVITRLNSKFYLEQRKKKVSTNSNISEFSVTANSPNFIKKNISDSHIISYKLRIYKRFIKNGTLTSSAIVYNFITQELRFMTKGIPEEILDKCDKSTIPDNFDNVISIYRRQGFILVICAFKIIDIDEYKDSNSIDDYMNNLTFCGFVTLKNKLKIEIINSIRDLRQFNCNLIISSGDNIFNCLPIGFDSSIIENKNIFCFDKEEKKNKIIISKIYSNKKVNDLEEENDKKTSSTSFDKLSKQTISNKIPPSPFTKPKETVMLRLVGNNAYSRVRKETVKNSDDISRKQTDDDNEEKETNTENRKLTPIKNMRGKSFHKKYVESKSPLENNKTRDKEMIQRNHNHTNVKSTRKELTRSSNITPLNLSKNRYKTDNKDGTESNTNRKFIELKNNKTISNFEKLFYYPGIFEENEDLTNNCIYCISGRAFNFLYKNKEKKHYKILLEKIHKYCKIFYNMSSLDKSQVIDYYREYPDSCVCTIGKYQNDYDAIMTSNVGINLSPPKNQNTILCHFYSGDSNILSIKKIIREGRTINENILLLKITSFFYTLILNSYILCCFMMEIEVINGQLNLLELCFLIFSVTAFTVQYDTSTNSNPLIQNRKLYIYHYTTQIFGVVFFKISSVYMLRAFYIDNDLLPKKNVYKIFITYYFILCIEQCFSTFFVLNYISFYRKHPLSNITFVTFNLVLFIYFIILITLNSSNFRCDIFGITDFELNEDLIDSFDDRNRLKCFRVCALDFTASFIYSRIVYLIFDKLANKSS